MALSRYEVIDAYTLEELKREYQTADIIGRIKLLSEFYANDRQPPYEVAVLAVRDQSVLLRQWIARNGNLAYSEDNLAEDLKNDSDSFVRACLRENPMLYDSDRNLKHWRQDFEQAEHLERLAMMRNAEMSGDLLETIFDPDDSTLQIDRNHREELLLASLSNRQALETWWPGGQLWKLASRWPVGSRVPASVYRNVEASDETRSEVYRETHDVELRLVILGSCQDNHTRTIQLGMEDTDGRCRESAYGRFSTRTFMARGIANVLLDRLGEGRTTEKAYAIHWMTSPSLNYESVLLEKALEGNDLSALRGLATNRNISLATLRKVHERLRKLDDPFQYDAETLIETLEKEIPPEDPKQFFVTYKGDEGKFLELKIDWIGEKLLEMEKWSLRRFFK